MRERLLILGLLKKEVSERVKRREELARLTARYDRTALYEQVWLHPLEQVATSYAIPRVALREICRKLQAPVPPRGYWPRIQHGYKVRKPRLKKLECRVLV